MWRYTLLGKHSNRTPLSYTPYQLIIGNNGLKLAHKVEINQGPDVLIFGHKKDFEREIDSIQFAKKVNPDVKIILLSEEPFWDSIWDVNFFEKRNYFFIEDITFEYHALNHTTTKIFNFVHIPYFITTNLNYLARYNLLFSRNSSLEKEWFAKHWKTAPYDAAFFAEKRLADKFSVDYPTQDVRGLCQYRSVLTRDYQGSNVLRIGRGWKSGELRQNIPDWHLDKITQLDEQVKFISALENTHQPSYITEKIFDAYATKGIPLYYASQNHRIFNIIEEGSFINLYGLNTVESLEKIKSFCINDNFLKKYISTQNFLKRLFSDSSIIKEERERISLEIDKEVLNILNPSGHIRWSSR
jgi:hypothetical protein